ncbi:MAG: hypothetical protein A2V70_01455 [Planctomycetes bacterium RBG_13_63_9]|nr:MAG: hypothetical protein A2V70_01455 [Planctomycetes bacterium RBG_13_63_9]
MNLVGKILTVLILVMSLLWAAFAVAVYATHTNWKLVVDNPTPAAGKPEGLKQKLEKAKKHNEELQDRKTGLEEKLAEAKKAAEQARGKLASEYDVLQREHDQLQQRLAKLVQAERDAVAAMAATQKTLEALRQEVTVLRANIAQAQTDRDAHFDQVVKLTDELNQKVNQLKQAKARETTLAADHAKALEVLRKFGLSGEPELYADQPPDVEGIVLAVTGDGLVEISNGSDEGLLKGHKLHVYRVGGGRSVYVGRIEVVRTDADRAVCKIDPKYQKSPVQKGDRVASKIE